ncbi:hypothetical protein AAFX24_27790 [Vibrio mediterranei]|uniref:hypothetical protein n=1 Tax=Vibrio mediterranei TaxID=689 RepID=UPI0038CE9582
MSMKLKTSELAEIATTLIAKPELLGMFDVAGQHEAFLNDLADVICDHCGGKNAGVHRSTFDEEHHSDTTINIDPSDSLPSLNNNIWTAIHASGWEGVVASDYQIEEGETLSPSQHADRRTQMRSLFTPSKDLFVDFEHELVDYRLAEGESISPEETAPYSVKTHLGNQPSMEFTDMKGDVVFGFIAEVSHGVPVIHIDAGGDSLLHVHAARGGVVLTPEPSEAALEPAPEDCYFYDQGQAYFIK